MVDLSGMKPRHAILCIYCLGFFLVLGAGCAAPPFAGTAAREFQGTYNVTPTTSLEVYNLNGGINVLTSSEDVAHVNATLSTLYGSSELDRVQIQVTTGTVLHVETIHPTPPARVTVNYLITIPYGIRVSTLQSSNGGITVSNATGTAALATSNGHITVDTFFGDLTAHTSNGAIDLRDVNGLVSAITSNAEITLQNVHAISRAETSNGQITADVLTIDRDVILSTSNGRVLLQLAPNLNADLSLSTSNGQILLTNVPVNVQQSSRTGLQGTIGSGGNTISVVTSNADIEVRMLST